MLKIHGWRRAGAVAAVIVLAAVVTACGSSSPTSASSKATSSSPSSPSATSSSATSPSGSSSIGTLNYVIDDESWPTLDPASGSLHGTDQPIMSLIYGNLVTVGPNHTYKPGLLASYSLAPNAMSFTMNLRPGLKFQDGTPLNATALKDSLTRDLSPSLDCTCLAFLQPIKTISTPSATEVVLHFSHPDGTILAALAASGASYVTSPTAVAKEGSKFGIDPVGAGPFRVTNNIVNSSITLTRWPGYWDAKNVHLGTVKVTSGTSGPSEWATLQSGGAQLLSLPFGNATVEKEALADSSLNVNNDFGYADFIYLNPGAAPFNNILAREAVQYATDAQAISQSLELGLEPATQQLTGSAQAGYPGNDLPGYRTFDLAKAKALVSQLHGLSFTVTGGNTTPAIEESEALAKEWEAAGMHVTIDEVSETAEITDLSKGDFQAVPAAYAPEQDTALSLSPVMYCPSFFDPHFCDHQVNSDLTAAESTPSLTQQGNDVRLAMERAINTDAAFVPLFEVPMVVIAPKSLSGLDVVGGQVYLAGITSL